MKQLYFLILTFITSLSAIAQPASDYKFAYKSGIALENMADAKTILAPSSTMVDEYTSGAYNVGFNFLFANKSYSTFSINTNGIVALGSSNYSANTVISDYLTQSNTYPFFAPYGDFAVTGTNGSVTYKLVGTEGSRKLVIDFKVKSMEDINTDMYTKNFQVWLIEGSNRVEFVYGVGNEAFYTDYDLGIAGAADDVLRISSSNNAITTVARADADKIWPGVGKAYIFSPTAIVENVPSVKATVSMFPEFPVEGQLQHTIYLGYGAQSVTLQADEIGGREGAVYSYVWSSTNGTITPRTYNITVSPVVTTTYTVRITDEYGATMQEKIEVKVIDARCGKKVKICKDGNEICVATQAVKAQLKNGEVLGGCTSMSVSSAPLTSFEATASIAPTTSFAARTAVATNSSDLLVSDEVVFNTSAEPVVMAESMNTSNNAVVYPNPSTGTFNVPLDESTGANTIVIFDRNGKTVDQKTVNGDQRLAKVSITNKVPGMYFVKVINQNEVRTSKVMVK